MQLVVSAQKISNSTFFRIRKYFLSNQSHPSDRINFPGDGVYMKLFFDKTPEEVASFVLGVCKEDKTSNLELYNGKAKLKKNDVLSFFRYTLGELAI